MAALEAELAQWRDDLFARIDDFEAAEREGRDESGSPADDVPEDAPPAYRRVAALVASGRLDWLDVIDGDSDDVDVRAVHVWLSGRVALAQQVFRSVAPGMTPEEAEAAIESVLGSGNTAQAGIRGDRGTHS